MRNRWKNVMLNMLSAICAVLMIATFTKVLSEYCPDAELCIRYQKEVMNYGILGILSTVVTILAVRRKRKLAGIVLAVGVFIFVKVFHPFQNLLMLTQVERHDVLDYRISLWLPFLYVGIIKLLDICISAGYFNTKWRFNLITAAYYGFGFMGLYFLQMLRLDAFEGNDTTFNYFMVLLGLVALNGVYFCEIPGLFSEENSTHHFSRKKIWITMLTTNAVLGIGSVLISRHIKEIVSSVTTMKFLDLFDGFFHNNNWLTYRISVFRHFWEGKVSVGKLRFISPYYRKEAPMYISWEDNLAAAFLECRDKLWILLLLFCLMTVLVLSVNYTYNKKAEKTANYIRLIMISNGIMACASQLVAVAKYNVPMVLLGQGIAFLPLLCVFFALAASPDESLENFSTGMKGE